jgi:hypothetical protein
VNFAATVAKMGLERKTHLRAAIFKAVKVEAEMLVQRYRGSPLGRRGCFRSHDGRNLNNRLMLHRVSAKGPDLNP